MSSGASMDVFIWFCLENIFEVMNIINRVLFCLAWLKYLLSSSMSFQHETTDIQLEMMKLLLELK